MMLRKGGRLRGVAGYQMVDSFTIKNFRSFSDVKVDGCRRINILVGDNGSGKTALLEALFLVAGVSPEIAVRTRVWRGGQEGQAMSGSHEDLHQALWGDLFFKFQTGQQAFVSMKGKKAESRSVSVTLNRPGQVRVVTPRRNQPGAPVRVTPITAPIEFKWKIQGHPDVLVEPYFDESKLIFPPTPGEPVKAAFYAANYTPPAREMTARFSELSKSFIESEFVEDFLEVYPTIKNLSLELSAGSPLLFATVEGLPQKIPLSLASGGMNKLVAILLSMTAQSGGIVIVDEIENGFYYKRLPAIWDALLDFSRKYDCQLFISTHSAECLSAVAKLAAENPDEFCMLRTVRGIAGTVVRQFEGDQFADAILGNVEVR